MKDLLNLLAVQGLLLKDETSMSLHLKQQLLRWGIYKTLPVQDGE
jgi:hypothetical protein